MRWRIFICNSNSPRIPLLLVVFIHFVSFLLFFFLSFFISSSLVRKSDFIINSHHIVLVAERRRKRLFEMWNVSEWCDETTNARRGKIRKGNFFHNTRRQNRKYLKNLKIVEFIGGWREWWWKLEAKNVEIFRFSPTPIDTKCFTLISQWN